VRSSAGSSFTVDCSPPGVDRAEPLHPLALRAPGSRTFLAQPVRILLPWAGLGFAMILLFQIADRLAIPAEAVSALLILFVSLTAFAAGSSGFPMLFWVGLAMGADLATGLLWPQSRWLLFGVPVCGGLIGSALVERRAENK
jgi:hypothetical protein